MKSIILGVVVAVVLMSAYWLVAQKQTEEPLPEVVPPVLVETDESMLCAQVITPAQNPDTGEIVEFPTSCDVPDGWEPIQPEGLELETM